MRLDGSITDQISKIHASFVVSDQEKYSQLMRLSKNGRELGRVKLQVIRSSSEAVTTAVIILDQYMRNNHAWTLWTRQQKEKEEKEKNGKKIDF